MDSSEDKSGNKDHEGNLSPFRLSLDMTGDTPGEILEILEEVVLPMLTGGIIHADNESITTGVSFHFLLKPAFAQGVYLDGKGSILAVDDDGEILAIVRPDGTEDETARQLPLSAVEWSELHGGLVDIHTLRPGGRMPTREQIVFITKRLLGAAMPWPEGE